LLSPSTIRIMAKYTSGLTEYNIKGILKILEVIQNDEDYQKLLSGMDESSRTKEAKIEAILSNLDRRGDAKLLGVMTELIKQGAYSDEILEINRHLVKDGLEYSIEEKQIYPTVGRAQEEQKIISELDGLLGRLNPEYVKMHDGAWESFSSGTSDSHRQSISSMRELFRQVIDQLAPSGKTRKEKIQAILTSTTQSNIVEALAKVVDELYALQSAGEHTTPDYESTVFALRTTEYVLYYLLKQAIER